MKNQAIVDALRTVSHTGISGSYAAVGGPQQHAARIICFTNTTDADVIFSMDGSTDQLIVTAGGFKLFDISTNHRPTGQDDYCFSVGIQWYVKEVASVSKGSVYIEIVYAQE